jgi:hypothetical protein
VLELLGVLDEELVGVLDGVLDEEAPELVDPPDDALLPDDDVPETFTAACVDPGRTATTTPATTTLAKDTVTVVVFRRRRPCSRSATARASLREAAWPYIRCAPASSAARSPVSGFSQPFISISLTRAAVRPVREESQNALSQRRNMVLASTRGPGIIGQ